MIYPNYLVHFNRNHDKNGRFTFGDGDGDGRRSDSGKQNITRLPNTGYHREGLRGAEKVTSGYLTKSVSTSQSLNNRRLSQTPNGVFKMGRRTPPEKSGGNNGSGGSSKGINLRPTTKQLSDYVRNSNSQWDSRRGSNINVVGGSSKGYGSSLSAEQLDEYRVAGQNWVVDKLDEITDPEWWKEKEKNARVQLGLYKREEKTVPSKSHEVTPKAAKVTKSTPKKSEKMKTK